MDEQLVKRLLELNQTFYSRFARDFSETRSGAQGDIARVGALIGDGAAVLDVGCGNGRLAAHLDKIGRRVKYLGVDASGVLIAEASARQFQCVDGAFRVADVTQPGWSRLLPTARFDIALALAVLHHIPSFELRCAVLRETHAALRSHSTLILTNWQFDRNPRLRRKVVPWRMLGIDERALEQGDTLLDWRRGGIGYRYCHLLTRSEVDQLALQSRFVVVNQFLGEGDLNLYSVLRAD